MKYYICKTEIDLAILDQFKGKALLACDTETEEFTSIKTLPIDLELEGIGLYAEKIGVYIPVALLSFCKNKLQEIFNSTELIFHNSKFDLVILKKSGFDIENIKYGDTMIMSWLVREDKFSHGLKYLAKSILKRKNIKEYNQVSVKPDIWKYGFITDNFNTDFQNWVNDIGKYCIEDCRNTFDLYYKFKPILEAEKTWKIYAELELPMVKILLDMEEKGITLDVGYIARLEIQAEQELNELKQKIWAETGKEFEINSPKQLREILFQHLKYNLPDEYKTPKGEVSTNEEALIYLRDKQGSEVVKKILEYRELNKLKSTYLGNMAKKARNSIIYPSWNGIATRTGRLSCSRPNLTNQPTRDDKYNIRKGFIPRKGFVFVDIDYCLSEGTKIFTKEGIKNIEEVQTGDFVLQPDKSYQRVINAKYTGEKECVEIITQDGYKIISTLDHKFKVCNREEGYIWRAVKDIREDDYLHISGKYNKLNNKYYIKKLKIYHYNEIQCKMPQILNKTGAELLGYIVGNGHIDNKKVSLTICGTDQDLLELLKERFKELTGRFANKEYYYPDRNAIGLSFTSVSFSKWLLSLKINHVFLDFKYFLKDLKIIASFLRGYFEADGSVSNSIYGRVSLSSTRQSIIQEVQLLLNMLGIHSVVRSQKQKGFGKQTTLWMLSILTEYITEFEKKIGFLSIRKRQQLRKLIIMRDITKQSNRGIPFLGGKVLSKKSEANILLANARNTKRTISKFIANKIKNLDSDYFNKLKLNLLEFGTFQKIKKIKKIKRKLHTYDLSVSNTHMYIANGFVVHNCQCELRLLAYLSQEEKMIEIFKRNEDIHQATADQLNVSRKIAKAIIFGLSYGLGAYGLARQLDITVAEAQAYIDDFFIKFPKIKIYQEQVKKFMRENLYVKTIIGRRRHLSDYKKYLHLGDKKMMASFERLALNSPVQGCLSGDCRIFVEGKGMKKIKELVNQNVKIWDGNKMIKVKIVFSGKKQKVQVLFKDGSEIICSPDHKFLEIRTDNKEIWTTPRKMKDYKSRSTVTRIRIANEVQDQGAKEVVFPKKCTSIMYNSKLFGVDQIFKTKSFFKIGQVLGRVASDGEIRSKKYVFWLVAEHEKEVMEFLFKSIKVALVAKTCKRKQIWHQDVYRIFLYSKIIADQLEQLGIKKKIPEIMWENKELLAGYLSGVFDGDGTVNADNVVLTWGYKRGIVWAREIQIALRVFGIQSRVRFYDYDRVVVQILKKYNQKFRDEIGFINKNKQCKLEKICLKNKIYKLGEAIAVNRVIITNQYIDMYDVLDSQTSKFAGNGIILHNSASDLIKIAMRNMFIKLRQYNAYILLQIHDELLIECPKEHAEEVSKIVKYEMENALGLGEIKMIAEPKITTEWQK